MNTDTTPINYTTGYAQVFSHRFPYRWTLKDAVFTKNKGKVFSCFACGGGSTMGYKLAGFDVIGCNEIDPKMIEAYKANHNPKYAFLEPIQTFKIREDLPQELYELDILDGSPPCSSFSMAGNREKDWGKDKVFREGQAMQVLDTLFFDFIDLAKKLQPKVVVAENVKGLLLGEAKQYVRQIYREFDLAGYYCQHWLLDASKMGVPQRRERVFFICLRKDLAEPFLYQQDLFTVNPKLELNFNEPEIPIKQFAKGIAKKESQNYSEDRFGDVMLDLNRASNTIATDINRYWLDENTLIDKNTVSLIGSYPIDYNHLEFNNPQYLIGMSVPPVMTANIATEIYSQWLSKCMIGANKLFEKLRLPQVSNCSLCSKCGEPISSRWEESACYFKLEIGIDCMATEALFGKNDKTGFNHPAIKQGSGYQKLLIESKKGSEYMLCWNCHRDFVKQVGKFLKE